MPMRVGFSKYRKDLLEQELANIEKLLPTMGVEKVILVGDLVAGECVPDSSIELIFVHDTDRPFGRRADFFSYHLDSQVAVDTQVYTPEEFERLQDTLPALRQACRKGRVIFDA